MAKAIKEKAAKYMDKVVKKYASMQPKGFTRQTKASQQKQTSPERKPKEMKGKWLGPS